MTTATHNFIAMAAATRHQLSIAFPMLLLLAVVCCPGAAAQTTVRFVPELGEQPDAAIPGSPSASAVLSHSKSARSETRLGTQIRVVSPVNTASSNERQSSRSIAAATEDLWLALSQHARSAAVAHTESAAGSATVRKGSPIAATQEQHDLYVRLFTAASRRESNTNPSLSSLTASTSPTTQPKAVLEKANPAADSPVAFAGTDHLAAEATCIPITGEQPDLFTHLFAVASETTEPTVPHRAAAPVDAEAATTVLNASPTRRSAEKTAANDAESTDLFHRLFMAALASKRSPEPEPMASADSATPEEPAVGTLHAPEAQIVAAPAKPVKSLDYPTGIQSESLAVPWHAESTTVPADKVPVAPRSVAASRPLDYPGAMVDELPTLPGPQQVALEVTQPVPVLPPAVAAAPFVSSPSSVAPSFDAVASRTPATSVHRHDPPTSVQNSDRTLATAPPEPMSVGKSPCADVASGNIASGPPAADLTAAIPPSSNRSPADPSAELRLPDYRFATMPDEAYRIASRFAGLETGLPLSELRLTPTAGPTFAFADTTQPAASSSGPQSTSPSHEPIAMPKMAEDSPGPSTVPQPVAGSAVGLNPTPYAPYAPARVGYGCPYLPGQSGETAICGIDCGACGAPCCARWKDARYIPWSLFGPGEYVGPARPEHVSTYYLRVNDLITLTFITSRRKEAERYRIGCGDRLRIEWLPSAAANERALDRDVMVQPDGTIPMPLVGDVIAAGKTVKELREELIDAYGRFQREPQITVTPVEVNRAIQDIIHAVTSISGSNGQTQALRVTPEGTIQAPGIGSVYVQGLTLEELRSELEARYSATYGPGLMISPSLTERATSYVFIGGEVKNPGRYTLEGPTTVMQAIALAGSWNIGGNLHQVVIFRRDENWCLKATKIDIRAPLYGNDPCPANDVWLRENDLVIVPKSRILCATDVINLYFTRGVYAVFPISFVYDFSTGSNVVPVP